MKTTAREMTEQLKPISVVVAALWWIFYGLWWMHLILGYGGCMSSSCVSFMAFGLQIQERGIVEVA